MRVLLTGATGFLGGRVAHELIGGGMELRSLCRPGREALVPPGTQAVPGELADRPSLERAARGCDAIVHLAARVTRGGARQDFVRDNVDGLRNVLDAAAAAGVSRIAYASSFFALGPSDRPGIDAGSLDEAALDVPTPDFDHYQATKHQAALLARSASDSGAPLVTLYPGVLVGPGRLTEGNFVTAMLRDHLSGRLVPLPSGGRRLWSFVHVDDVARAFSAVLVASGPSPAYVVGGENATLRGMFADVELLTGRRPPWMSAPLPMTWCVGLGEEIAQAAFGRAPTQLTRGIARALDRSWALRSERAERELGRAPRPLRTILVETIAWLEAERLVPAGTLRARP